jgi:hypothetical protein
MSAMIHTRDKSAIVYSSSPGPTRIPASAVLLITVPVIGE